MTDEKPTTALVKREATETLALPGPNQDIVVLARDPQEMAQAQQGLIDWFTAKLNAEKLQLAECEENLAIAKRMKTKTEGWRRQVSLAQKRVTFYTKGLTALEEGYCIIPDFPVQLIAVRTTKKRPPRKNHSGGAWHVPDVESEQLPQGEGRYVSPAPEITTFEGPGREPGKTITFSQATSFDVVDFPFKQVKPQILRDLDRAMKSKLFDEIGVLPGRTRRNTDPVIVGRIKRRVNRFSETTLTFLVTWWIDSRDL